ncbi:hypothetical protein [Rhodospirillaceae bacterium SYSU D60014]|uniref:hypothetical protein n=1 Tax=Virgifigura deserti TaxID=2268457 RepID=UPI0013C49E8D
MEDSLTLTSIKDVLLFLLAIYGAVLSTFNWRQSIRRERRTIHVDLSTAMPAYNDGRIGQCFAKLEATNTGYRAVTVTTLTLELPEGGRLFPTAANGFPGMADTVLPATLSDGQSAQLFLAYRDIAVALVQSGRAGTTKLTPICEDSARGIYKGKSWEVNPVEFSRM